MTARKLWVPNVEEVLPENDPLYDRVFIPKTLEIFPRFLLCLATGDSIVSPRALDPLFCRYIAGVSGLGAPAAWLLTLKKQTKPYSLVESILSDDVIMAKLKAWAVKGGWAIEPFIESPRVTRLSRDTGIPTDKTIHELVLNGVITRLNDKGHFKDLTSSLGIKSPGGYLAQSMPALERAITLVAEKNNDKVMLRKTLYGGGLGNLPGSSRELLWQIREWYGGGRILVEPFLDIREVSGSLAVITDSGTEFLGVDVQTFCDGRWNGFDFPHHRPEYSEKIKNLTMKCAAAAQATGARGYLNVDWAATSAEPEEPLSLECNFRNNGFAYILEFARRYFARPAAEIHIRYREGLSCKAMHMADILKKTAKLQLGGKPLLITVPGAEEGAVITTPPSKSKFSLAIFGKSGDYVKAATAALAEAGL